MQIHSHIPFYRFEFLDFPKSDRRDRLCKEIKGKKKITLKKKVETMHFFHFNHNHRYYLGGLLGGDLGNAGTSGISSPFG
jgi:hypothetical protein